MCKSHCNHTPAKTADHLTPTEPAWIEKLGGVVIPAVLTGVAVALGVWAYQALNEPLRFDPDAVYILKAYAIIVSLGFWTYMAAAIWHRGFQRDIRVLKTAIRWLILNRKVRSTSLRLVSIQDELELAQDTYWWGARENGRDAELSREIVRLREYRDALRTELDRLMAELREARPDRFN